MSFFDADFPPDGNAAQPQRTAKRDSLFLGAIVTVKGEAKGFEVRVRNLSAGGLLAESKKSPPAGSDIMIELRNIGEVAARVMWSEPGKFGVSFLSPIDPQAVRKPVGQGLRERDPVLRPYYPNSGRSIIR